MFLVDRILELFCTFSICTSPSPSQLSSTSFNLTPSFVLPAPQVQQHNQFIALASDVATNFARLLPVPATPLLINSTAATYMERLDRKDFTTPPPLITPKFRNTSAIISRRQRQRQELDNSVEGHFKLTSEGRPMILTNEGWVQGYFQKTSGGRRISAYESIPYAKPPVGQRRFSAPVKMDPWPGVKATVTLPPLCLQMDFTQAFRAHGFEDCLYLNVYSPQSNIEENKTRPKLPVIVYIHGGGYSCGYSGTNGAAYLLDNKDQILVTVNYRVGIMGFLSTGDKEATGNWGLKDQTMALNWVSKNIQYFGGDPSKVTLMGESAGAASVGLHLVSPLSSGLFQRAICQSGSNMNHWSLVNETIPNSVRVAQDVGCPIENTREMIRCMRTKNPYWIVGRMVRLYKYILITRIPFGPVVEPFSGSSIENPSFLPMAPEVAYEVGQVNKVPLIIGFTLDEGVFFAAQIYLLPFMMANINRNWNSMMSYSLHLDNRTENSPEETAAKIRKFYLPSEDDFGIGYRNRKKWMKVLGDRTIVQGVHLGMQFHSQVASTYGFVLSYQGQASIIDSVVGINNKEWGISHGDDLIYIFNSSSLYKRLKPGSKDWKISEYILDLWSNFAATGIPSSSLDTWSNTSEIHAWKPIIGSDVKVLNIDTIPEMIDMPFMDRLKFWESLRLKDDPVFYPKEINTTLKGI